jgi:hypothetical protein
VLRCMATVKIAAWLYVMLAAVSFAMPSIMQGMIARLFL